MRDRIALSINRRWYLYHFGLAIVLLFLPILFTRTPHIMNDTSEYVGFFSYLPPLYPIFLRILLLLSGENIYLWIAIVLQTVFAAYIIDILIKTLSQYFEIDGLAREVIFGGLVASYYLMDTQLCVNLWIATEGLSLSLFYVVVITTVKYLMKRNCEAYVELLVWTTVLTWCRSQFVCCYIMVLFYIACECIWRTITFKRALLNTVLLIMAFLGMQLGCQTYKNVAVYKFEETYVYQTVGKHLMYYATEEDALAIEDPGERELFLDMLADIRESGFVYKEEGRSLIDSAYNYNEYFGHYYDYMVHISNFVLQRHPDADEKEYNHEMALVMKHQNEAMKEHMPQWVINSLTQFIPSLGNSVALYTRSLAIPIIIYTFLILIVYIGMVIRIVHIQHSITKEVAFAAITLIYLVGNALYTNLAVAYMMRYVSYITAIFYIALIIMYRKIKCSINLNSKH